MAEKKQKGADLNVVSIARSARALARKKRHRDDPPPMQPRGPNGDIYPNRKNQPPNWSADELGLPAEDPSPAKPIGHLDGTYYFLSSSDEFRALTKLDHEQLQKLYALTPHWPQWAFPRHGKQPPKGEDEDRPRPAPIESFKDDDLRGHLLRACERQGLFDPAKKMRGRGGWIIPGTQTLGADGLMTPGRLVYHAGEAIWELSGDRFVPHKTGLIGPEHARHLYPRLAPIPEPWELPVAPADNPAGVLFETYAKWNWTRPLVDPLLVLGHNVVSYLGGALDWRPCILVLGDHGWGKSALRNGLTELFGEDALLGTANTSAAGIYQILAHDCRPVAVDELEPGADQQKIDRLVDLMRQSASGDFALRGSSDNAPVAFQMRSAFYFSAINNPLHKTSDLSRVAVLRLQPIPTGQAKPAPIDPETAGPMLLARVMREWHRFGPIRAEFRKALAAGGHNPRGCDTYGTLLACAELALGSELATKLEVPLSEDPNFWADHLSVDALPELELAMPNWRKCVSHMLRGEVGALRNGIRQTVGRVLEDCKTQEAKGVDANYTRLDARRDLETVGLGLLAPGECKGLTLEDGWVLAVPNDHKGVARLFAGETWEHGGWMDALRQCPIPGVMIADRERNRVTIAGQRERCTLIVLRRFHEAPER